MRLRDEPLGACRVCGTPVEMPFQACSIDCWQVLHNEPELTYRESDQRHRMTEDDFEETEGDEDVNS
jgi:predicted nucleic acid-binding Zn ribbon protein